MTHRKWRYHIVDPGNVVIAVYATPEKIGVAWRAREGGAVRLRVRKARYDFGVGETIPNGLLWELDVEEALKTGLNIDEWSSK